jgi:hypothetical protein
MKIELGVGLDHVHLPTPDGLNLKVPGPGWQVLELQDLVQRLPPDQPFHGLAVGTPASASVSKASPKM